MARIGTNQIGSLHQIEDPDDPGYFFDYYIECQCFLQPYILPYDLYGSCLAYIYCYKHDGDAGAYPVIFSDSAGQPNNRISSSEQWIDLDVSSGQWKTGYLSMAQVVPAGTKVWFGFMSEYMIYPCYENGGNCHFMWQDYGDPIPDNYQINESKAITISQYLDYRTPVNYLMNPTESMAPQDSKEKMSNQLRSFAEINQPLEKCHKYYDIKRTTFEHQQAYGTLGRIKGNWRNQGEILQPLTQAIKARGWFKEIQEEPQIWDYPLGRILKVQKVLELQSRITGTLELSCPL
ncbi:MAG: hypothetical protein PF447_07995 [Spirochaetaceae bacterium]|jgi:hypothetical protein|nr:hypothetical protein [Spirochaetaceae bacterium]